MFSQKEVLLDLNGIYFSRKATVQSICTLMYLNVFYKVEMYWLWIWSHYLTPTSLFYFNELKQGTFSYMFSLGEMALSIRSSFWQKNNQPKCPSVLAAKLFFLLTHLLHREACNQASALLSSAGGKGKDSADHSLSNFTCADPKQFVKPWRTSGFWR